MKDINFMKKAEAAFAAQAALEVCVILRAEKTYPAASLIRNV